MTKSCNTSRTRILLYMIISIAIVGVAVSLAVYFTLNKDTDTKTNRNPNNARPGLAGPLVDYVYETEEPSVYGWSFYKIVTQPSRGVTSYFLHLTSQKWLDEDYSDRTIWWHNLIIHAPDDVKYPDQAFLWVSHYDNTDGEFNENNEHIRRTAEFAGTTGIPAACLQFVPNQPIVFMNDGVSRDEGDLVTWTMRRYYNDSLEDKQFPEMLSIFPMMKAVTRAMDAITEFGKSRENPLPIEKFVVGGESKRGWAAWIAGALDKRVTGIVPVVLSSLNFAENLYHYWRSFGGWPWAMVSYYDHDIFTILDEPGMIEQQELTDPLAYKDWLDIPKLAISSTSDEYFLIDDYEYYWDALPGEKHMWLLENTGHTVRKSPIVEEVWQNIQTFHLSLLQERVRPTLTWTRTLNASGGMIKLTTDVKPNRVESWSAPSNPPPSGVPHRRDWRLVVVGETGLEETGITWTSKQVTQLDDYTYEVYYPTPDVGFLGFYIKVIFPAFEGREYIYSTEAVIIPDTFPFESCDPGLGCRGTLV